MTSYPYLQDLFTSILAKSKAIQGRFYVCPRSGHEINSQDLEQVITELPKPANKDKYPLVLMMPPLSLSTYTEDSMDLNKISLFFLKVSYNNSNSSIANMNPKTRTSQHTVTQDWHDMKRCAVGFIRAIGTIQDNLSILQHFQLGTRTNVITPVSFIGSDRVAGVRLDFEASLFTGCDLEDYNEDDLKDFVLPLPDSHPEHKL